MLNSISLKAQTNQSDKPFFMGITSYAGQFQVHTKSLYPYNDTHPFGVELEFSQLLLKEQIRETFGTLSSGAQELITSILTTRNWVLP